jgi:hypothetical protein
MANENNTDQESAGRLALRATAPSRQHGEIAALLIEQGLLKNEQLAYAARVQSKLASPKPILDVIKELKLVTDKLP